MRLTGEVALVTGAGRGFGRAIAQALAGEGASVALIARSADELDETAATIRAAGGQALPITADVTNDADIARAIAEATTALGAPTIFVNNAGVGWPYGPIAGVDVAKWWQAQELHQLAPMLFLSRLLPGMIAAGRGHVVLVSAIASRMTVPNLSAYIAGKSAQRRLAEVLAVETADHGVAAFAIDPGFVVTALARDTMTSPDAAQHLPGMVARLQEMQDTDYTAELAACGRRVADLCSGTYDRLSGRYFEMSDDLAAALAETAAVTA